MKKAAMTMEAAREKTHDTAYTFAQHNDRKIDRFVTRLSLLLSTQTDNRANELAGVWALTVCTLAVKMNDTRTIFYDNQQSASAFCTHTHYTSRSG